MSDKPKEDYKNKWIDTLKDLKEHVPLDQIKKRPKEKLIEVVLPPYGT